jgi:hypothetical protein
MAGMTSLRAPSGRGPAGARPKQRSVAALIVLAARGAACTEGYPTDDAPSVNPGTLTSSELVQLANQIGDQTHLDRRWKYALSSECELVVSTSKRFNAEQSVVMPLRGSEISTRAEGSDSYEVLIQPSTEPQQELIALEGGKWADGLRMRSLLDFLRNGCLNPPDQVAWFQLPRAYPCTPPHFDNRASVRCHAKLESGFF